MLSVTLQTHNYPAQENVQYYHHCYKFVNFEREVVSTRSSFFEEELQADQESNHLLWQQKLWVLEGPIYQAHLPSYEIL